MSPQLFGRVMMTEYTFTVRGMSCEMCEAHINDAVRACGDVKRVKSDRKKNQTVALAESLDTAAVVAAIRALGYDADDAVGEAPYEKKSLFGRKKTH